MNNLEKLKEINPPLYQKIKLKHAMNDRGIKTYLDSLSLKDLQTKFNGVELETALFDMYFGIVTQNGYAHLDYLIDLHEKQLKERNGNV